MFKHKRYSPRPSRNLGLAPLKLARLIASVLAGILAISLIILSPVSAVQSPTGPTSTTPDGSPSPSPTPSQPTIPSQFAGALGLFQTAPQLKTEWIRLDGTRLFQIAGYQPALSERRNWIQSNLHQISRVYLSDPEAQLTVEVLESNQQPVVHINGQYLLTVTAQDAQLQGLNPQFWAEQLRIILTQSLQTTRRQHQPAYLIAQVKLLGVLLLGLGIASLFLSRWQRDVRQKPVTLLDADTNPLIKQRSRVHQTRIRELQRLLLNAAQFMLWTAGALFGLSRFPQTRVLAIHWVSLLKIPLVLGLAILGSHILIRLSHITIDRFSLAISTNPLLPKVATDRVQQRIGTLSQVSKSLSFLGIALTSLIFALVILGVNIAPLLAGAGILGVGISLASQGIIKDTINGFLIVFEDQYGVGDIVQIGDWTGLVETLNLRMTQLRNAEGKLITIPNGEIKVVANLSSQWSRVDLNIPIPYEVDLETMMELIEATALDMQADERWRELILETPQMMGVEDFSDRGLILKLWIKTQPLKQWEVAREYRRRLKLALDQAKIQIPAPQRAIWMHAVEPYNLYPKE